MDIQSLFLVVLIGGSAFYFLVIGVFDYTRITASDEYFIAGRQLGTRDFSETFVATTISLTAVVTFFLTFSASAGLAIIWNPITYIAGTCFYIWLFNKFARSERGQAFLTTERSVLRFIANIHATAIENNQWSKLQTKFLLTLLIGIAVFSMLSIFTLEVFVATKIGSILIDLSDRRSQLAMLTMISLVIFTYVYLGGFKSIVRTDHFQLYMMGIGFLVLLLTGGYVYITTPSAQIPARLWSINPLNLTPKVESSIALVMAFLFIQSIQYFTHLGYWQRVVAVGKADEIKRGLFNMMWGNLVLWSILIISGLLYAGFSANIGLYDTTVMLGYLQIMKEHDIFLISVVGFALVVCAFFCALISSADSHLIPLLQSYVDDIRMLVGQRSVDKAAELGAARKSIKYFLVLALALFFVLVYKADWKFDQILFSWLSLMSMLVAPMFAAMFIARPHPLFSIIAVLYGLTVHLVIAIGYGDVNALVWSTPMLIMVPATAFVFGVNALLGRMSDG